MDMTAARQARNDLRTHLQPHLPQASYGLTARADCQPGHALLVNLTVDNAQVGDQHEALIPSVFEGFPVVVQRVGPSSSHGRESLSALEANPETQATFEAIGRSPAFTLEAAHAAFVGLTGTPVADHAHNKG